MSETIVVGVTEAPVSSRAVDWAVARAADLGHSVELLSIVGGAVGVVGEDGVIESALDRAQRLLDAEVERVSAVASGVTVSTRVGRGNPVKELIDASTDAALLVIGSDYRGPGTGGPSRGAHGLRIVTAAKAPVVVVPDIELGDRNGVVVGVDGSEVSEAAIRFAAEEAARIREPLIAVGVWTPLAAPGNLGVYPEDYLVNMQGATEEVVGLSIAGLRQDYPDLEIKPRIEQGYPSAVINEAAASARITVVGSHGRGAFARFLLGSVSQEVLARLATVTAVVR